MNANETLQFVEPGETLPQTHEPSATLSYQVEATGYIIGQLAAPVAQTQTFVPDGTHAC